MKTQRVKEKILAPDILNNTLTERHVLLPDGTAKEIQLGLSTDRYAIMCYGKFTRSWTVRWMTASFSGAVQIYNSLDHSLDFYCIAEVLKGLYAPTRIMMNEWYAPIPTIYGFIERYRKIDFKMNIYTDRSVSRYSKYSEYPTEITQSLSNAFVNNKRLLKEYHNDCVVLKYPTDRNGYGFTFQYGKYYFLGYISDSDAKEFIFPHKEKTDQWIKTDFMSAVNAFNNNKVIRRVIPSEYLLDGFQSDKTFANYVDWKKQNISFLEIHAADWYILKKTKEN